MKNINRFNLNSSAAAIYIKNNKWKVLFVMIFLIYLLYKIWYVVVCLGLLWSLIELLFYYTHKKPLKDNQIKLLSEKRKKRYVKKTYSFILKPVKVNLDFKSSMKAKGEFYKLDNDLAEFPSLIAQLLKGKKHEWVILAIEKDKRIIGMWANKGNDGTSVSFKCELKDMIEFSKQEKANTILRYHNHPNSNPQRYNYLFPSKQDKISANWCSSETIAKGINWIDFICERGKFIKYAQYISNEYYPDIAKIENIQKENNISKKQNYKLHRELGLFRKW